MTGFYHDGMRAMQDRFDSRRLADRLERVTLHDALTDADRAMIEAAPMVFLATADAEGRPDCSYKGGHPGFVRVLDDVTIAIAVYDGNGQFRTLGNITANPAIGLLFVDFAGQRRMRLNGHAELVLPEDDATLVASFHGADAVLRVTARQVFPNCGRYLHDSAEAISPYAPAPGHEPPVPEWKTYEQFKDVLPHPGSP